MLNNQKKYLQVKVLPKSSQQKVVKQPDGFLTAINSSPYAKGGAWVGDYKIYLKSAPEKGRANKELIKVLSRYLAIHQKQVKILKGEHSRDKIIEII